jgi:hypothetical protein
LKFSRKSKINPRLHSLYLFPIYIPSLLHKQFFAKREKESFRRWKAKEEEKILLDKYKSRENSFEIANFMHFKFLLDFYGCSDAEREKQKINRCDSGLDFLAKLSF